MGQLVQQEKEGGDGLMDDGWYEEKNIFPSKDYPHSHAHTFTIQAHTHTHTLNLFSPGLCPFLDSKP